VSRFPKRPVRRGFSASPSRYSVSGHDSVDGDATTQTTGASVGHKDAHAVGAQISGRVFSSGPGTESDTLAPGVGQ